MESKKVSIIGGGGKMGRWMARFFRGSGFEVVLFDTDNTGALSVGREIGVAIAPTLESAVNGADYVVISVPILRFEEAVQSLASCIVDGQNIVDITSTKVMPVDTMHRYLPGCVTLGAHPLFGPGAGNIVNKNVILTPTNDAETALAEHVSRFLKGKGASVSMMSPVEHDRMMSLVLGLSHFIALVAADTLLSAGKLHPMEATGSSTYKVLLTLVESVLSEDPDLYASIQMSLPDVKEFESLFSRKSGEWAQLVAQGEREEFAGRMQALKNAMEKASPDFKNSYEKMYRIVEGL